jgi:hypothetical protein
MSDRGRHDDTPWFPNSIRTIAIVPERRAGLRPLACPQEPHRHFTGLYRAKSLLVAGSIRESVKKTVISSRR